MNTTLNTIINRTHSALTLTQTLLALALSISASSAFADDMTTMHMAGEASNSSRGNSAIDSSRSYGPVNPGLESSSKYVDRGRLPCSNPTTLTLNTPTSGPAHINPTDFSAAQQAALGSPSFHQLIANKQFGYTFDFKTPGGCCEIGAGTLTVYYRAVQGGSSANSSDAGNDVGELIRNGVGSGGGHIYTQFPFAAGTQKVVNYSVPAGWIASGRVSFIAEDDTAVDHATLTAQMCCVHATPATP